MSNCEPSLGLNQTVVLWAGTPTPESHTLNDLHVCFFKFIYGGGVVGISLVFHNPITSSHIYVAGGCFIICGWWEMSCESLRGVCHQSSAQDPI